MIIFGLTVYFLKRRVDTERYEAIGASFYAGYSDFISASIICIDKQKSTADKKYIVDLSFENKFTQEEFFNLFKRFKVIITKDHGSFEDLEIDEEIIFDDRN